MPARPRRNPSRDGVRSSVSRAAARRPAGGGLPWLGLLVLGGLAAAVFVARGPDAAPTAREAEPTGTVEPTRLVEATRTVDPTRPVVAQAPVEPTRPPARATSTRLPATAATTTGTSAPPTAVSQPTRAGLTSPTATSTAAPATTTNTTTTATSTNSSGAAPRVALTFDAGADRGYAEDILDLLAEQHVPASFGITGQWARANAELVRRMADEGHLVINHTLDHRSFTGLSDRRGGLSAAARRAELDDADAIIAPLIGQSTRPWYRLPYGDGDGRVVADVASAGYTRQVGWTVDSLGWRGLSSADILARCLKLAAPGAIYVLHVGRASHDAQALPALVRGLRERGFAFVRVDGL